MKIRFASGRPTSTLLIRLEKLKNVGLLVGGRFRECIGVIFEAVRNLVFIYSLGILIKDEYEYVLCIWVAGLFL
jgi:hypothetical protein